MLMRITLSFSGSSNFDRNTVGYRGALHADEDNTLSFSGNGSFKGSTTGGSLSHFSSS